jgi:cell division protein FtsL
MGKLLICLTIGLIVAAIMLQLRQQYLSLNYQTSRLHSQIESRQAELWSQQLRIAEATAPNAIAAKVKQDRIRLAPQGRPEAKNWIDPDDATTAASE